MPTSRTRLEAHPDLDRNDLDAAIKAVLRFHDVDAEWKELLERAGVVSAAANELSVRAVAALKVRRLRRSGQAASAIRGEVRPLCEASHQT